MKLTTVKFNQFFLVISGIVLFATTIFWSTLSAGIYQMNADQIADPYLFVDWATFSQSMFPAQHSFFLKWPLFVLIDFLGNSPLALAVVSIIVSTVTVGGLAWILMKIEKRPLVLGLLLLGLSSVLLGTAIEPKPGSLLPLNIGMLTTRNIEYLLFLGSAYIAIKAMFQVTPKKTYLGGSVALLAVLVLSDQLFVPLAVGGALLVSVFGFIYKNTKIRRTGLGLLAVAVIATATAFLISIFVQHIGLFVAAGGAAGSPYGLLPSPKDFVLGIIYGLLGILSVLGANPMVGTLSAPDLPAAFIHSFQSLSIVTFLVNIAIVAIMFFTAFSLIRTLTSKPTKKFLKTISIGHVLGMYVILSSLICAAIFVITKHYYAVDARYLALFFFAGFIALAVYLSDKKMSDRVIYTGACVLSISCATGIVAVTMSYNASSAAYQTVNRENDLIRVALEHHQVRTFAADYWRVYPVLSGANEKASATKPLPMESCTEPRNSLASKQWQHGAFTRSFAYLLTTETTGTGYPACTLTKVRATFGSPSDSVVISGTAAKPTTMLLFYDNGKNGLTGPPKSVNPDSLLKEFSDVKDTVCSGGRMIVQTVAHQDDDILFMNPDLAQGVQKGDCIRTVYFTAGDAGSDKAYWLGREEGAKAAYAALLGIENPVWRSRDILLSTGHQVKLSQLVSNKKRVTLLFVRLPDGNVDGSGFGAYQHQTLQKLYHSGIPSIQSVDGVSNYTKDSLEQALMTILEHYQPQIVRSLATENYSARFSDHSDHIITGQLTERVFEQYKQSHPDSMIIHYIGYPIHAYPPNVSPEDVAIKKKMFYTFSLHDPSACSSDELCARTAYRAYLDRQYTE